MQYGSRDISKETNKMQDLLTPTTNCTNQAFFTLALRAPHPEEVIERNSSEDIEDEIAPEVNLPAISF